MESNLPWSVYEFKIIQNKYYRITTYRKKIQWLCNFTFLTPPWPITSRSSKVVCERIKLNRTDVIASSCAPWQIPLKKCARKNKDNHQHKQRNVGFLSRQKMSQSFPLDMFGRMWGQQAHRPAISPHDSSRNPYKSPPTIFKSLLCRHFCLLHPGIPLIISSHTSSWVCISV